MTTLAFRTATLSHTGGRPINEDACGYRNGCWVVADGLGGHGGGEVASRLAVDSLLQQADLPLPMDAAGLIQALAAAEQAIHHQQKTDSRLSQMRTTLVLLCSDGHNALWAHIGDSRLYHLRDGRIHFQTRDHSVPQAIADAGEIAPAEIRFHEDRNRLLRSLGNDKAQRPTLAEALLPLRAGDVFLLCTDGFWEYVTEAEMEVTLAKAASPGQWLQSMAFVLLRRATAVHDNYTALAVFVDPWSPEP
ncbi:MAG: protein phosphatase 2C domain-containing protein [Pseudomonadota bacterium]